MITNPQEDCPPTECIVCDAPLPDNPDARTCDLKTWLAYMQTPQAAGYCSEACQTRVHRDSYLSLDAPRRSLLDIAKGR